MISNNVTDLFGNQVTGHEKSIVDIFLSYQLLLCAVALKHLKLLYTHGLGYFPVLQ